MLRFIFTLPFVDIAYDAKKKCHQKNAKQKKETVYWERGTTAIEKLLPTKKEKKKNTQTISILSKMLCA